jgi:phenylacetate-CoA ligase
MEVEGTQPHYQIFVDRKGAMDDIEIMVEVNDKLFSDELKVLHDLSKRITDRMRSVLGISAKVTLVEPLTIARSEGKAQRVVDRRKI